MNSYRSQLFPPVPKSFENIDDGGWIVGTSTPKYSIINIHEFLTGSDRELLTY
jgi:hypothetical protein